VARKPFDPSLAHGALFRQPTDGEERGVPSDAASGARAAGAAPMTVSALAARIKEALRLGVPGSFTVRGELGRVSRSQHFYATLREADATISLVMFARELSRVAFEPREGMAVVVRGRLDFYGPQGKLQVIAESMEPDGQGDLDARKRELERLFRERGWFDAERKRAWPRVPRHVAIVTSEGAAALQDVLNVHRERGRTCRLTLVPTLVQGDRAAAEVAAAIERANAASPSLPFDCILLVRGGGSKEDLWAFNEAAIVEAIVKSRLPVVTGIGHQIDVSLADLAADGTAATPSLAAASVFADRAALDEEVEELRRKLAAMTTVNLEALAEADELATRLAGLETQLTDITVAKDSIAQLIARIDDESRRLLGETIETVRGHFRDMFERLFGGGQADILLEEGVDLLETAVEIVARPPGKEPRSISLLSGGEKTMTCVALLLAIFKSRPSPFCVLDEVDAALDESNVDRFVGVIRDFLSATQFIVVTHSKKTMAAADTLYGVTMEESGVSKRVAVRLEQARVTLAKAA